MVWSAPRPFPRTTGRSPQAVQMERSDSGRQPLLSKLLIGKAKTNPLSNSSDWAGRNPDKSGKRSISPEILNRAHKYPCGIRANEPSVYHDRKRAASAVREFRPKMIYPIHFIHATGGTQGISPGSSGLSARIQGSKSACGCSTLLFIDRRTNPSVAGDPSDTVWGDQVRTQR
jgi:hypothetical protein